MARSSSLHEVKSKPVIRALQHVEGLSEAEIAQDIHGQVAAPVAHVLGHGPALGLAAGGDARADLLAKGPHVLEDVALDALHGAVAERLAHDAPLAGVDVLVARVVRVGHGVRKGVVELGLAHVGLEAVDVLEGRLGVEGDAIGGEAHHGPVALVQAPELEVPVTAVGMVELVGVGEFGDDGAGILGERVEEDVVNGEADALPPVLVVRFPPNWIIYERCHVRREARRRAQRPARRECEAWL